MIVKMMQNPGNKMEASINRMKAQFERIQKVFKKDL